MTMERCMLFAVPVLMMACSTEFQTGPEDGDDASDLASDEIVVDIGGEDGDGAGDGDDAWDGADAGDGDDAGDGADGSDGADIADAQDGEETTGPFCGDGGVDDGEECDDGNGVDGDGCDSDCTWTCHDNGECRDEDICNGEETCNMVDHVCEAGEPKDDGFVCRDDPRSICLDGGCGESECGDGFVDTGGGESCEPPGEGTCSATCNWQCDEPGDCADDGNPCNGEEFCDMEAHECGSRSAPGEGTQCADDPRRICIDQTCQESTCGDGFVDGVEDEECEDVNMTEGDGCDNDCTFSC
ncbi:MAG: DUF4215 domain-containing protein, partial [Pseudomonadota bacterium]